MVRIIDGEVVQDDDPRLQQRQARSASTGEPSSLPLNARAQARAPRTPTGDWRVFDWSAPPLR